MDNEPTLSEQIPDLRLRIIAFFSCLIFSYLAIQNIQLVRTVNPPILSTAFMESVVVITMAVGLAVYTFRPTSWRFDAPVEEPSASSDEDEDEEE